jgi:hypothetical protein
MASSQPKAAKMYFTELPTIRHYSGYTFQQRGGRVYVENAEGEEVDTISSADLQEFPGQFLTTSKLRKLAVTWLDDFDDRLLK